ncbi:MAG: hypothetical protein KGZ83_17260 [Sulfuricella sp.]|nr:hypothetical protein [Sulfuricella sp.]
MFKFSQIHLAVLSALTLGTSLPAYAATVSGKVIAGAAVSGATVCIDKNRNKACDSDETKASTGTDGTFSVAGDGADQYPVIAEIAKTASRAAYTLEAPVGKYAVISPYSTLVKNEMDNDTGMSLAEAEVLVKRDFLVSGAVLYADYSASGGDADAKAKATVIADMLARQMDEAGKLVDLADLDKRAAAALYARNTAGQSAIRMVEAIAAAGGDAGKAADKLDLTDPDRAAILQILEREKLVGKVVTRAVKDTYPGNMLGALSYDASTNRVKFSVSSYKDGEVLRIATTATTPDMMKLDTLAKAPLSRVASFAALPDGSMRVMTNAKSETVWTTMEVDLGGQTIPLSQLIAASNAPSTMPTDMDIKVTFQAGDKMWREHHTKHPFGPDQVVFSSSTKDTNVASLEAWVKSKNDIYNVFDTLAPRIYGSSRNAGSNYDLYFKPTSATNPLAGGDVMGHNITAKVESKVGSYYTQVVGGVTYLIVNPAMLTRQSSAGPKVFIYDAATKTIKYASYRDYVNHCLCWQRKLSVSALNRIADALRSAHSILITPATNASTATGHYLMPAGAIPVSGGFAALDTPQPPSGGAFCGGCVLGNCGACPISEVIGMR